MASFLGPGQRYFRTFLGPMGPNICFFLVCLELVDLEIWGPGPWSKYSEPSYVSSYGPGRFHVFGPSMFGFSIFSILEMEFCPSTIFFWAHTKKDLEQLI